MDKPLLAAGAAIQSIPCEESGTSAPAKQNEGFHWAFSFDVDDPVRLQPKALVDVSMGGSRDLVRFATPCDSMRLAMFTA